MTKKSPYQELLHLISDNIEVGTVQISNSGVNAVTFQGKLPGVTAKIDVRNPDIISADILKYGISGFLTHWLRGDITSDNISTLLYLLSSNTKILNFFNRYDDCTSELSLHPLFEYSEDFLSIWMGKNKSMGAGFFDCLADTLTQAVELRYLDILQEMNLRQYDNILYIGQTFGSFPVFFCNNTSKNRLHCLTANDVQKQSVKQEIKIRGIEKRLSVDTLNINQLNGRYDFIVINHIIETINPKNHYQFFYNLKEMLRPEGKIIMQLCTANNPSHSPLFLFISSLMGEKAMTLSQNDLNKYLKKLYFKISKQSEYGKSFARTCKVLRTSLNENANEIRKKNYPPQHRLFWDFWLALLEVMCLHDTITPRFLVIDHTGNR